MGSAAFSAALPEELDHATFKTLCGDRYEEALFDALKDPNTGCVSKAAFEKELSTKTHVFLTHDWGTDEHGRNNHERVTKVNTWLRNHGIVTWFDLERMRGNIIQQMFQGIDNTRVVVVFVTKNYMDKVAGKGPAGKGDNCLKEFEYAERRKTSANMLTVVQEQRCRNPNEWIGSLGLLRGSMHCDNVDDDQFESNMLELLKKIKEMIPPSELDLAWPTAAAGGGGRPTIAVEGMTPAVGGKSSFAMGTFLDTIDDLAKQGKEMAESMVEDGRGLQHGELWEGAQAMGVDVMADRVADRVGNAVVAKAEQVLVMKLLKLRGLEEVNRLLAAAHAADLNRADLEKLLLEAVQIDAFKAVVEKLLAGDVAGAEQLFAGSARQVMQEVCDKTGLSPDYVEAVLHALITGDLGALESLAASASAPAAVGMTAIEAEERKCEKDMLQWLCTHAPGVLPPTAATYAKAFCAAGATTVERLGRKLARDGTWLAQLNIDKDDAEDITAALVNAGYLVDTRTHVFLSHDWGTDEFGRNNHERVARINKWLQNRGIVTWFDEDRMKGNIVQQMQNGIDKTSIVLVFVTKNYMEKVAGKGPAGASDNCLLEFKYAERQKTLANMLAVVQEKRCRYTRDWTGPLGLLGGSLYCDNSDDDHFESNMQNLLKAIKDRIPYLMEDIDGALDASVAQLCDDYISDTVEADFPRLLIDLAMELGEKAWGRSKIMFVGPGRAGKTGTERAVMGFPFEDTASTTGINDDWTCEVTHDLAHVDGEAAMESFARWKQAEKADKEYEAAVAKLAAAIKQGKVEKEDKARLNEKQQQSDAAEVDEAAMEDGSKTQADTEYEAAVDKLASAIKLGKRAMPNSLSDPTQTAASDDIILAPVKGLDEVSYEDAVRLLGEQQMNSKLLITMLDFGGQKVFDAIHQFFLTEYAVYVVVFNMECYLTHADPSKMDPTRGVTSWVDCMKNVKQWVGSVVVHTMRNGGRAAPIFIVGTHKDMVPSVEDHRAMGKLLKDFLGEDNPAVASLQHNEREGLQFFPLNNKLGRDDPTMEDMMKQMETVIEDEEYVKRKRPLLWFRVLDWINTQDRSYVTYDEIANYARQSGFDTKALDVMLNMFHESSALMWHSEEGLRHLVIREPISFFVTPATNVICQHTGTSTDNTVHALPKDVLEKVRGNTALREDFQQLKNTGIVSRSLLEVLLRGGEHWKVVELLMIKYALLVPLRRDGDEMSDADPRYLVPALLPEAEIDDDVPEGDRFFFYFSASTIKSCLRLDKGFLPSGLFARVLGVVLAWSQETTMSQANYLSYFRHGMTAYFGSQRFKLIHRADINAIEVQLYGAGTPLAVHARLKAILDQLIEQCYKSLHYKTLLVYTAGVPAQGPAIRPSTPTDLRPLYVPLEDVRNLIAKRVEVLALTRGVELKASQAVDLYGQRWVPDAVTYYYDVFISYRWSKMDTAFTGKLENHLQHYTVGEDNPQPIMTFLDVLKLELGLDFKEAFVKALTRSKVVVPIVSHDALARMMNHDATAEDNLLIEWLCAKYCLKHGIVKRILPVFFGKRTALGTFGGDFFDVVENVMQQLSTSDATATFKKASQLLKDAGVLDSSVAVVPALFGLGSFTVREIVQSIVDCNGIKAWKFSSMLQLLQKCGGELKTIISEDGGSVQLASQSTQQAAPSMGVHDEEDCRNTPVAPPEGFDAAWAVLRDPRFVADAIGLQKFLDDGFYRDSMHTWAKEDVDSIKEFLNRGGKSNFDYNWKKATGT